MCSTHTKIISRIINNYCCIDVEIDVSVCGTHAATLLLSFVFVHILHLHITPPPYFLYKCTHFTFIYSAILFF
jgi:hypothetical protein